MQLTPLPGQRTGEWPECYGNKAIHQRGILILVLFDNQNNTRMLKTMSFGAFEISQIFLSSPDFGKYTQSRIVSAGFSCMQCIHIWYTVWKNSVWFLFSKLWIFTAMNLTKLEDIENRVSSFVVPPRTIPGFSEPD